MQVHSMLTSVLLLAYGGHAASTPAQSLSVMADATTNDMSAAPTTTIISRDSFSSQSAFDAVWDYNYPWGTDHNGAARMDKGQSRLDPAADANTLTMTAKRVADGSQKPASHGGKSIPIHYLSGTVHARQHITVAKGTTVELAGDFRAPVARGTWPAFWLTAVDGWPPEVDLAEWKGSGKISFNTFNTSSQVAAKDVAYPSPGAFHAVRCVLWDANGRDVGVRFYMDGQLVTTQVGRGFTGKALYLILDLQMEGSSGSPGPSSDTEFVARGVSVISYKTEK
ncbi:glycoside hydrolase [Sporothrix brasiliensis 5110]|uniref:Glycoside hydrolase n=1 Tax=Sporothrix brasiliensis 5110 TaxID=1398154 RepID=A0A0C2INF0_9PEZI|nr:glycoside hydrolase [Sporothrix brasiliensis 5110]KIH90561.1 glycoside hydrolase [Sporothrix brasiliensis 5110]